ncbi:plant intracellular Ras-group-related LRR protein 6 [Physcomitrium patens]|uniref:Disease resistance R13L4/SHOC-2-like LRR domain-containing protein n=1 Tax=Physcomitrium patens TaxID=3218 RepID=A9TSP3_PHYPA|nr:plant intracellular Ras-group-related LRR protein 6-like [Physcomitrium patens]PNR52632.1 hypothetical protein PHYPA_009006 [Physcomitrium patens]|eukprot:XP_024379499.1 plant intracellular Ras-group-related LRR protein 6-like [Physcomitrella patens]
MDPMGGIERLIKAAKSSGSLNLSNRGLAEVPPRVYNLLNEGGSEEKWWEVVEIHKLDISHNSIAAISDRLGDIGSLTFLNLSHNQLSFLPPAIGNLSLLKILDISGNSVVELPSELGFLTALVRLNCASNSLSKLSSSLGNCTELVDLKAHNNLLVTLPEELGNCSKLSTLNIESNRLSELSESLFSALSGLTELIAGRNSLTALPNSLGRLSKLIRLDLHQNRLTYLPPTIAGCVALMELYLGDNLLKVVPDEIGSLKSLSNLDLHSNQLTEFSAKACLLRLSLLDLSNNNLSGLPAELGAMTSLRKLLLVGNPMRSLRSTLVMGPTPALLKYLQSRIPQTEAEAEADEQAPATGNVFGTIGLSDQIVHASRQATASKVLSLPKKNLSEIPPAAWEGADITTLDLSHNQIKVLPTELAMCSALEVLMLSNNKFSEWPGAVLGSIPNLHELLLAYNPFREFPQGAFVAVAKLTVLDLSGVPARLPPPPALAEMPNLQELRLKRAQLQDFREDLKSLQKLRILDVSQNFISVIPEWVTCLARLETLDISDNNISQLPPKLGLLEPTLKHLKVDGNPLRSIRRPILEKGTKTLLQYLQDRIPAGAR